MEKLKKHLNKELSNGVHWLSFALIFLISASVISGAWGQTVREQDSLVRQIVSIEVARGQTNDCTITVAQDGTGDYTTIQEAADVTQPGDVVCVEAGTYAGLHIRNKHGEPGNLIVFKPSPGQRVIIDSNLNGRRPIRVVEFSDTTYVEINGFELTDSNPLYDSSDPNDYQQGIERGGIKLNAGSNYIRIVNNHMYRIAGMGILTSHIVHHNEFINNLLEDIGLGRHGYGMYIKGSDQIIRGNIIRDAYGYGIHMYADEGGVNRNLIENNIIYNNGRVDYYDPGRTPTPRPAGDGIIVSSGIDNIVRNNLVYNNMRWGIRVWAGNTLVVNNTVYANIQKEGILITSSDSTLRNNIIYQNPGGDIKAVAGVTQDHNLTTNPGFISTNPASADFLKLIASSPAINAGILQSAPITDILGNLRDSQPDIGAYEYGSQPNPSNPGNGQTPCTSYASPGDNLSSKVNLLDPNTNHTLCLRDGTYFDSLNITKSGQPGKPITIRAENDGQAVVDGQGVRKTCRVLNQHDVVVEGIICQNSSYSVFDVSGSENIIVRRVSAYNAKTGRNAHVFSVAGDNKNVLLEDTMAGGTGRDMYLVFANTVPGSGGKPSVTLRRCYGQWKYYKYTNVDGGHFMQIYGSSNVLVENCVGTKHPQRGIQGQGKDVRHQTGITIWANKGQTTNNNKVIGNVMYDYRTIGNDNVDWDFGQGSNHRKVSGNRFSNNVSINNNYGFGWYGDADLKADHLTIVDADTAWRYYEWSHGGVTKDSDYESKADLKNSVLVSSRKGIDNSGHDVTDGRYQTGFTHSYNNLYNISTPYIKTSKGVGELSIDPAYPTSKYGKGAYLMRAPALKGQGEGGADIGAEVLYQYQDGVLTNQRLWPWPMEDRIMKELGVSVTWEDQGGLWKQGTDFNEVYTNNPAPDGSTGSPQDGSSGEPDPGDNPPSTGQGKFSPDLNCDNKVNVIDFGILLSWWGPYNGDYSHPNCSQ